MKKNKNPFSLGLADLVSQPTLKALIVKFEDILCGLLSLKKLQALYQGALDRPNTESPTTRFLKTINVNYDIVEGSLDCIPEEGPVVVVANHPFGGIEGIVMLDMLQKRRSNVKVLANYMLERIPELRDYFIFVDPFGQQSSMTKNIAPMRQMVRWLQRENILGVFPSGTVSHFQWEKRGVSDPEWNPDIARIIRVSNATVVPMYFEGRNTNLFQIVGLLHPLLRTILIPKELCNKQDQRIKLRIGSPIAPSKISSFDDDKDLTAFLRLRTYLLGSRGKPAKIKLPVAEKDQEEVIPPLDQEKIIDEITALPKNQELLESGDKKVYFAHADQIPITLQEIGRLRELAFRKVGEGTGKSIDLDRFDNYYTHLFVWNTVANEIVGAYRIARTDKVVAAYGQRGLYTSTLFDYQPQLLEQMGPALELGRSFVRLEYQKQFSSLHLLWKGIGRYVVINPKYKILFGTVSISNDYDSLSRRLIAHFLKENLFLPDLAKLLKAKNPANSKPIMSIARETSVVVKNIDEVSELIAEIETKHKAVPVLLRQYLKLGGKLLGFNLDKNFGDVMDGLIYIDLTETDRKMLNRYFGEQGAETILNFHKSKQTTDSIRA